MKFIFFIAYQLSLILASVETIDQQQSVFQEIDIQCQENQCLEKFIVKNGRVSLEWQKAITVLENLQYLQLEVFIIKRGPPTQSQQINLSINANISEDYNVSFIEQHTNIDLSTVHYATILFDCKNGSGLQKNQINIIDVATNKSIYFEFNKSCPTNKLNSSILEIIADDKDHTNGKVLQNNTTLLEITNPFKIEKSSVDIKIIPPENYTILFNKPILSFTDEDDENNKLEKSREIRKIKDDQYEASFMNPLVINPFIKCKNVSENLISYTLTVTSAILSSPIQIYLKRYCRTQDDQPQQFSDFNFFIGTEPKQGNIYKPGKVAENYIQHSNKKNDSVRDYSNKIIPVHQDAFDMYMWVGDDEYGRKLKETLIITGPILTYEKKGLNIVVHNQTMKPSKWNKPQQILLEFICYKKGLWQIELEFDIEYELNKSQTIELELSKQCGQPQPKHEPSFIGDVIYYGLCLLAIAFGIQAIKLFKRLMIQEKKQEDLQIDTSYKRKYQELSEVRNEI